MKYLLGIDFGGGASKATLLSERGEVAATASYEYPTSYPAQGFAEQNPDDWYGATRANIAAVLEKSGASPDDIIAVALDAATHTAALLDGDFKPLAPAIYWTDSRSTAEVAELKEKHLDLIRKKALHSPDTIWTLPQLMWVKKHEPEVFASTKHILFAKDYVRHKLTGDNYTDFIEAEGSMLFDCEKLCWSEELCGILGLDMSVLPTVIKPTDEAGKITASAAADTGLSIGTPVICGTTDTVMEVFASGAVAKGQVTVKLATAGRICLITDAPIADRHMVNYSHIIDGLWYPGSATKSCAASLRWYRDTFGGDYKGIDEAAEKIPVGAEGLVFHPYLNGELTPYANPLLCGSFVGVRSGHTKAHFDRALLEGVAMSLLDCKKHIDTLGVSYQTTATIIGGGSYSALWRRIAADALNLTLVQKNNSDSSLGSAMLAGVAKGVFASPKDALALATREVSRTAPDAGRHEEYQALFAKYKAIQKALEPIYNAK